jgi:hypothetical protein
MTIRVYYSTDPDAPVLNGNNGSFKNVLDACLVTGYGSKPGAGWTKHFDATNVAAYRQDTFGHPGFYLRVDDNFATQNEALIRGYETMTDFNTGSFLFPTVTQSANGIFVRKRSVAGVTASSWRMFADAGRFYFLCESNGSTSAIEMYYFGTFDSFIPGDSTNVIIGGKPTTGASNLYTSTTTSTNNTLSSGIYVAQRHDFFESSPACFPDNGGLGNNVRFGAGTNTNIDSINQSNISLLTQPCFIVTETTGPSGVNRTIRGRLSGVLLPVGNSVNVPLNSTMLYNGDEYILNELGNSGRVWIKSTGTF